jgi:uncharacterized protein YjiS (DUF1127 family)
MMEGLMTQSRLLHSIPELWRLPAKLVALSQQRAGRARSRKALLRLDDHLLADVGLTRHEAETEAAQSSWNAPLHWRS